MTYFFLSREPDKLTRESPAFLEQMLDELIIAGEMQESSKKSVLRAVRPPRPLYSLDVFCAPSTRQTADGLSV